MTSESSPFESLCLELHVRILRNVDLPDLLNLGQTSKFCNDLASHDDVWIPNAIAVGCPIKEDAPVFGQVRSFFKELQKKVMRSFDRPGVEKIPPKIELFLKQPSISQIFYLQQWLIAKDTLTVWEELAKPRLQGPGIKILMDPDTDIEKAKDFPAWFNRNRDTLTQMIQLDLEDNHLTSLPEQLSQLTSLEILDLSNNQLSSLPAGFSAFLELENLYLSDNQFTTLPSAICSLTYLHTLDIRLNQLTSLPSDLAKLTHLDTLNLASNQLTTLPDEIVKNFFGDFDITGNPLSTDELMKYVRLLMERPPYKEMQRW